MLTRKKRPARRKNHIVYSPTSERMQYLETVKLVPKLFDELFNDYHHSPNLVPEIKKGLEKGWIKNEYVRKKFNYLIDRINDYENLDIFLEVLKTGLKEKFVTRSYSNKRLQKGMEKKGLQICRSIEGLREGISEDDYRKREFEEFRYAVNETPNGGSIDINLDALENGRRKGYFFTLLKETGDLSERLRRYIKHMPFWKKYLNHRCK